jgi:hypothetical protein
VPLPGRLKTPVAAFVALRLLERWLVKTLVVFTAVELSVA